MLLFLLADLPIVHMLKNESLLQSYLTFALTPIVRALASEAGVGIWEVINEPEGCMLTGSNPNFFLII